MSCSCIVLSAYRGEGVAFLIHSSRSVLCCIVDTWAVLNSSCCGLILPDMGCDADYHSTSFSRTCAHTPLLSIGATNLKQFAYLDPLQHPLARRLCRKIAVAPLSPGYRRVPVLISPTQDACLLPSPLSPPSAVLPRFFLAIYSFAIYWPIRASLIYITPSRDRWILFRKPCTVV